MFIPPNILEEIGKPAKISGEFWKHWKAVHVSAKLNPTFIIHTVEQYQGFLTYQHSLVLCAHGKVSGEGTFNLNMPHSEVW